MEGPLWLLLVTVVLITMPPYLLPGGRVHIPLASPWILGCLVVGHTSSSLPLSSATSSPESEYTSVVHCIVDLFILTSLLPSLVHGFGLMVNLYIILAFVLLIAILMWTVSSRSRLKERSSQEKRSAEVSKKQTQAALERPDKAGLEEILDDGKF